MTLKGLQGLLASCKHLVDLRIGSCNFFDQKEENETRISLPSLRNFSIHCVGFENKEVAISRIVSYFPNLNSIEFEWNSSIDAAFLADIIPKLPSLTAISLPWCNRIKDNALTVISTLLGPNLRTLNLEQCRYCTENGIISTIRSSPGLTFLSLKGLSELSNEVALVIAQVLHRLRVLNLVRCCNFNDDGVIQLLENCKELEFLSLVGLSEITDLTAVKLVELKHSLKAVDLCDTNFSAEWTKALADIDVRRLSVKREQAFIRGEILR
jgi:hypothetical protein